MSSSIVPEPVVIAGAGPNGLMLAAELSLAGVHPLVLDRLTEWSGEQRANGMVGQVVRMMDRRGLYERLSGGPAAPQPAPHYMFAAFPLHLAALADNPVYTLMVPQRRIEEVLAERVAELGAEVRRGHEVVGLEQDADGVTVTVRGPDGPYELFTRFLVGADGGRSAVRRLAGIDFHGVTTDHTVSRTAHLSVPAALRDPATGGLRVPGYGAVPPFMHHRTERGVIAFAPFPNGAPLVSTLEWQPPGDPQRPADDAPFDLAELGASVHRILGVEVPFGPPEGAGPHLLRRLSGGNTRLAERYRAGRVLLLGDAAHVHSAIGGPGLNLGLQDAVNLGWKLAAQVHGWAPDGLLDTYNTERRPAAQRVTMHTRAQSALITPGGEITALRELFGELLHDPATVRRLADLIAGADIRYDHMEPWAPDRTLITAAGPARLAELTRNGRPLLLDCTPGSTVAAEAEPWKDRVDTVTAAPIPDDDTTALLLRPDCYIAWSTTASAPDDGERRALRTALERWFGAPAR